MRLKEWITTIDDRQMKHQWNYSPSTKERYQFDEILTVYFTDTIGAVTVLNLASKELCNNIPSDSLTFTQRSIQLIIEQVFSSPFNNTSRR